MKRLSLGNTLKDAQYALRRFPLVLLCAVTAAIAATYSFDGHHDGHISSRILMSATLGIPSLLILALAVEQLSLGKMKGWLTRLAGIPAMVLYFFSLPAELPESHFFRFAIYLAGMHLLVAVAPFFLPKSQKALWQFNISLFQRLIASVMFTLVLYGGLCLALAAMDQLLGLPLNNDIYWKLFLMLGFIFNTWYFLGGVLPNPHQDTDDETFPRPLRVFAQHILSTLVVVYLAIMLVYLGKIIITGVWPSGWIGWLVSGVAAVGLLSVALLSPLQGRPENPWINIYFRIFHILMIPSVILLIMAVSKRIQQYGLTELRYLLLILSAWVMLIMITGLLSRRINLRLIPLSLGLIALLIGTGPWGAISMSRHSQLDRLQTRLLAVGLFDDGKMVPAQKGFELEDWNDLISSIEYQFSHYGSQELDSWLLPEMHNNLHVLMGDGRPKYRTNWARARFIVEELGLTVPVPAKKFFVKHTLLGGGRFNAISLHDLKYSLNLSATAGESVGFKWGPAHGKVGLTASGDTLVIHNNGLLVAEMPLKKTIQDLIATGKEGMQRSILTPEEMTWDFSNNNLRLRVIVHSLEVQPDMLSSQVLKLEGLLLLGDPTILVPGQQ